MCSSASLLVGKRLEQFISSHLEQPDFGEPQPVEGGQFSPGQQRWGFRGNVGLEWSLWDREQAACPPWHLSGP